jgi:hypothetical protein
LIVSPDKYPMSDDKDNIIHIPRDNKGRFPKGVSGNPNGGNQPQTKVAANAGKKDHTDYFRSKTKRVAEALLEIIEDSEAPAGARVSAAKTWFDQAFGKPAITGQTPEEAVYEGLDIDALSPEALAEIMRLSTTGTRGN